MRLIIAGSRDLDFALIDLKHILMEDYGLEIDEIVSGGARGIDSLGEQLANWAGIQLVRFPADWEKFGKGAGLARNIQMADYADELLAIWDGQSRGTRHMIDMMLDRGKPLRVIIKKENNG